MNSILIVYSSHYGSTQRYAQWIAEDLGVQARDIRQVSREEIRSAKIVALGGGLYAGGVSGAKKLLSNVGEGQRVCVFTCGVADPKSEQNRAHIRAEFEKRLGERARGVELFHVRGGLDYGKMSPVHRAMMAMMRRILLSKPKEQRTSEDEQILATYGSRVDFVSRDQTAPIVEWIRQAARSI